MLNLRNPCVFSRVVDIPPTIPPKPGRPLCYEQMRKFRFEWFVCGHRRHDGAYVESGPYRTRDAAMRDAGLE